MKNGVGKIRFAAIGQCVDTHRHLTKLCDFFAILIESGFFYLAYFVLISIVVQFTNTRAQKLLHILQRNGGNVRITVRTVLRDEQIDVVDAFILIRIDDLILIGAGCGKVVRDPLLGVGNAAAEQVADRKCDLVHVFGDCSLIVQNGGIAGGLRRAAEDQRR